ncbi:unnamed protein product [Parascedosporium putredinis]|uniref:Rhodopsin domain-containing protein n=1 Tax=Parascedosporium putredinis TaxID=1442378 RepID=A0A9P1HBC2_9PEZI|nr:unnamed protein product [Parascedosporium putredinis]CAI8004796.1 unnamed protein product [Parascedosporium putredinis]
MGYAPQRHHLRNHQHGALRPRPPHLYRPARVLPQLSLLGNFAATFALLGVMASKTSFAVTILRLTTEWTRALVWSTIIAINALTSVSVIMTWIPCDPRRASTVCVPVSVYVNYSIFAGAFSGAIDLGLALLPWYLIWDMNINIREKLGIGVAMSLGVCACATAILKCVALPTIARGDYTSDHTPALDLDWAVGFPDKLPLQGPLPDGVEEDPFRLRVRRSHERVDARGNSTTMSRRASEDPVISRRNRESGARGAEAQAASSDGWREESGKIGGKDGEATVTMSERRENDSDGYEMDDIRHMV